MDQIGLFLLFCKMLLSSAVYEFLMSHDFYLLHYQIFHLKQYFIKKSILYSTNKMPLTQKNSAVMSCHCQSIVIKFNEFSHYSISNSNFFLFNFPVTHLYIVKSIFICNELSYPQYKISNNNIKGKYK